MQPLTRLQPLRPLLRAQFHPSCRLAYRAQARVRLLHIPRLWRQDAPQQEGEVESFKVTSRVWTWRSIGLIAAQAGAAYFLWQYFIGNVVGKLGITQEELDAAEAKSQEEEEGDESISIALSYPQVLPRTFYRQSDPEWLEFVKLSHDEERKEAVREELAEKVAKAASSFQQVKKFLGNDIELVKYWLDLKFPDSPPPDYARKVIEIGNKHIALGTEVIPQDQYARLHHVLVRVPTAVFTATQQSIRVFFRLQLIKIKHALGMSLTPYDKRVEAVCVLVQARSAAVEKLMKKKTLDEQGEAAHVPRLADLHEKMLKMFLKTLDPRSLMQPGNGPGRDDVSSTDNKANKTSTRTPASEPPSTPPPPSSTSSTLPEPAPTTASVLSAIPRPPSQPSLLSATSYATDIKVAQQMFQPALRNSLRASKIRLLPRGAFLVLGQVEVAGTRGRVKFEVRAAYDPKTAEYSFVTMSVSQSWEHSQNAKGGP